MLLDKFNRPLDLIEILAGDEPSNGQVASGDGSDAELVSSFPSEHIVSFMKIMSALGLNKALLAGKEPLLRPDIVELVSGLSGIRPKVEITVRTGSRLLPTLIGPLSKVGMDRLWVAIPTVDPDQFSTTTGQGLGALDELLEGIHIAASFGVKVAIETQRAPGLAKKEMVEVALWATANGYPVRATEEKTGGEDFFDWILDEIGKTCHLEQGENQYTWNVAGGGPSVELLTCSRQQNCYECRRFWLSADGKIKLCSHHHEEHDLSELFDPGFCQTDLLDFAAKIPLNKPQGFFSRSALE
ncbi:MAG: radical SAM protein [Nitrospinota bacterium]|nr:radical SAM protein [Nitrospinota bacterium]